MTRWEGLAAAALAVLISGCATMPPASGPAPGAGATRRATAPPPGGAATAAPAVVDSGPSEDARRVLASIPEPLSPSERVAAPRASAEPPSRPAAPPAAHAGPAPGSSAPADTASGAPRAGGPAGEESGAAEIPVPAPTEPLGERPGSASAAPPDTSAPARVAPPPSHVRADTCWRVQIVAPRDKPRADQFRSAATSQLMVVFVVEHESGLYKVRTRDCLDRAQAEALRTRALQSGFRGAFLTPVAAQ